jgi:hypothetical protein
VRGQVLEVVASRGRKGTDPKELVQQLHVLSLGARKFGARKEVRGARPWRRTSWR